MTILKTGQCSGKSLLENGHDSWKVPGSLHLLKRRCSGQAGGQQSYLILSLPFLSDSFWGVISPIQTTQRSEA